MDKFGSNNNDKPIYHADTYPWWLKVIEWVGLRVIYFVGIFGIGVLLFLRYPYLRTHELILQENFWYVLFGISFFLALIGPWLYKRHVERNRGKLQEVKNMNPNAELAKRILEEEE